MKRSLVGIAAMFAAVAAQNPLHAQAPRSSTITVDRGDFAIAPFGGYLISPKYVEGPLGTSLGGAGAPLYGAMASLPLAPGASLVGTIGYAGGDLEVGVPLIGGVAVGRNRTLLLDASVELRLDSWEADGGRFIPVVQLGGGALRREVSVLGATGRSTDFVVSGGIGADVPIASNIGLRVMVKDHYGKADFGSVGSISARTGDLHTVALSGGLRVTF